MSATSTLTGRGRSDVAGAPPASKAAATASRGIRTAGNMADAGLALIEDVFAGAIDNKKGHLVCRAMRNGIAGVEFAMKHGYKTVIVDEEQIVANDPIAERKRELLAELAQLEEAEKLRR